MANRFYSPNQQFADATGAPYAGGSLAFYASGTSTPLATYSDSALTIANTNPVVLDSAGRAGNIFLQNLAYKVVLSDVNNNVIWTDDPVFSSDFSARAKLLTGSGSPNGNTAGTAGSVGIGADTYWDSTNNILYVCTTTGTASTAVWTSVNASTSASVVPPPQGYLTPLSGVPIITTNGTVSTLFYTPYVGNTVPIYNGSSFVPTTFGELILTLTNQTANLLYDVFVFNNSGVLTLAVGPAWAVSTPGTCDRGTGAGTTQLSRISGIWVNTVSMSAKNGATTYSIPANQGTYLGSLYIDSTPGQVSCFRTYGQARKWGIWNAYNRVPVTLQAGDGTASWPGTSATWISSDATAANYAVAFNGLAEEVYAVQFQQGIVVSYGNNTVEAQIGIGVNGTAGIGGNRGAVGASDNISGSFTAKGNGAAAYISLPTLGLTKFNMLEQVQTGPVGSATYLGTSSNMMMTVNWRA